MALLFGIVITFCSFNYIGSVGIDSSDASHLENGIHAPFYDALLFNDIAEILSEIDSNGHTPLDALLNSESESDENVDDLLSEYQHFLEKAHKQRKYYLEKTKLKNKVPLYRHDTYAKNKSGASTKYEDYTNLYKSGMIKFPRSYYNSPLEFLIPMNSQNSYYSNIEIAREPKMIKNNLDSGIKRSDFPSFNPYEFMTGNQNENKNYFIPEQKPLQQTLQSDKSNPDSDNAINIRIKVEIQAPKFLKASPETHHCRNHTDCKQWDTDGDNAPQMVTLPFSYYNLPIPLEMLSIKSPRNSRPEGAQYHKIMIHKKKKTRPSSASKKHRKKLITFHDVKFDPRAQAATFFVETFTSPSFNNLNITNTTNGTPVNITQKTEKVNFNPEVNTIIVTTTTVEPIKTTQTQGNEVIYLKNNISIHENVTDDNAKNENSIEVDDLKVNSSGVTEKAKKLRKRREITISYTKNASAVVNITENSNVEEIKKKNNFLPSEPELLYWPNKNTSTSDRSIDKNITMLILERENKKAKLNISKETIQLDHQRTLEKAIFGDVNWDDVDTVAPEFMSFVGKYIKGVLTFCSPTICHSMKCAQKECIHRICKPSERHNNNGHCVGSNSTDSVASMESIMDLPSNVAFEIVDILQDNMPGKMFGKVTLCISPKCITFASAKKNFLKHKCSIKDLNSFGHCQNVKNKKPTTISLPLSYTLL